MGNSILNPRVPLGDIGHSFLDPYHLMGKSQPTTPPAPPDYAAANEAAINADINTLPLRNAINSASTLGKSYTDPNGKTYDFSGLGSSDISHAELMQQLQDAPDTAKALLSLQQQYGTQFADEARKELQATDPTGFALRDQYGADLASGKNSASAGLQHFDANHYLAANPDLQSMVAGMSPEQAAVALQNHYEQHGKTENRGGAMVGQTGPQYESVQGNGPQLATLGATKYADTGAAQAGRSQLETQVFDDLSRTGQMDPNLQHMYEQAARARGAATGNGLGASGALDEAMQVTRGQRELDQSRQNNALGLLQSGQTTSDKANEISQQQQAADVTTKGFNNNTAQQGFQNIMDTVGQRNQTMQNTFAANQGLLQQQQDARQQDTANKQSFLGLQPVVSQGAQLGGLQQGAAPFLSGSGYQAQQTNPGAGDLGAQWAGQLYGAQNQYSAGVSQSNAANQAGKMQAGAAVAAAVIAI